MIRVKVVWRVKDNVIFVQDIFTLVQDYNLYRKWRRKRVQICDGAFNVGFLLITFLICRTCVVLVLIGVENKITLDFEMVISSAKFNWLENHFLLHNKKANWQNDYIDKYNWNFTFTYSRCIIDKYMHFYALSIE